MADTAEAPAAASPASKSRLPTILLIVNALLLVGVLAAVGLLLKKQSAPVAPVASAAVAAAPGEHGAAAPAGEHGAPAAAAAGAPAGEAEKGTAALGAGPTLRIADFVVHLRNPESDRYARFSFELEVATDKDKEMVTARTAQIRDVFITYLSDRTAEDLRGSSGLEVVKHELFAKVAELAKGAKVRQLYVTDFVIQ